MVPQGVPHKTTEEDTYMGYRIPKGATIVPVFWSMNLDEAVHDRPLEVIPERWLENPNSDSTAGALFTNFFGYGRRICTGRHIARNSLFILIARVLWAYNIKHAVDAEGERKEVNDMAFIPGIVMMPHPFEAVFEPRSPGHKKLIERNWAGAEKDVDVLLNSIREQQISVGLNPRA
jgi:cytochrome P450